MSNLRISLSDLDYGPEEEAAVLRVLNSKWLSMGPEVQAFESEFAELLGVKYAIAVANATAGLHLAFLALGIGPGNEIIQPTLNFVASANMTISAGAMPVFADIISATEPTIDPAHVERLITPHTKAVVVMHYGGYLCRMAELMSLCQQHGILLIEDACHAVGARYCDLQQRSLHGRMAGSMGDAAAFSFFGNKNLATGEGGMVVTNRDDVAERFRLLRSHGMTSLTWDRHKGHARSYEVIINGFNYRLDELHAALGRAQLAKLKRNNERRRRLIARYTDALKALPGWAMPFAEHASDFSGHLMVLLAPNTKVREKVVRHLGDAGVQTSLHYPCVSDFHAFADWRTSLVERSREFTSRAITLPLHPLLTTEQVDEICALIVSVAAANES